MHQTRSQVTTKIPIPRKGTRYVARALNHHNEGVPVVIAVRDMLGLAKTTKEVKKMKQNKSLKINGREIKDIRECIKFLNLFEADKTYKLTLLSTGRFNLEETKDKTRIAKVIGKKTLRGNNTQINLHDGSNVITKEKINVGDSLELDLETKIKKVISFEKGREVVISSGRSLGMKGKIENISDKKVKVSLDERSVDLNRDHLIVIK